MVHRTSLRQILPLTIVIAVLLPAARLGAQQPKWMETPLTDEAVEKCIQRGVEYLWKQQHPKEHHWEYWTIDEWKKIKDKPQAYNGPKMFSGPTALVLLALHKAGQSQDDPRFVEALKFIAEADPEQVYSHGMRAALFASLNRPKTFGRLMEQEKQWLLNAIFADGTYSYLAPKDDDARMKLQGHRDYSNTQYGILGMWLLSDAGAEVPRKYWQLVEKSLLEDQCSDGGWQYGVSPGQTSTQTMTLAGLASLFIVWDKLYAVQCDRYPSKELLNSIDRGLNWMGKNFKVNIGAWTLYGMYGIERVGVAAGLKYFGNHNWWDICARYVMATQQADGSWQQAHDMARSPVTTSWALLFLTYGRAPVVFNKLDYGPPTQWNSRPRDLARLTLWMDKTYERPFNWQVMPIERPVDELLDAPILLMSGVKAINLTAEQKAKLRDYVLGGGTLLGEAAHDSTAFTTSFRALIAELFPELEMQVLPNDHPIYTVQFQLGQPQRGQATLPQLEGISNGIRTLAVLSPKDLGCTWQRLDLARGRSHFELGANLAQYVSDKGTGLIGRGTSYLVKDQGNKPAAEATVGRFVWGPKYNWDPEPFAWKRVDVLMRNAKLMGVKTIDVDLSEPVDPKAVPMIHLTGVGPLKLSEKQTILLKSYVQGGGLLLVDAAGGSPKFAESFQKAAGEIFGQLVPAVPPFLTDATDNGKVQLRHVGRLPRTVKSLDLLGRQGDDGRWQVLFLPYDLTAAMTGYPNVEPYGLTPAAADQFISALLKWRYTGANKAAGAGN